MAKPFKKILDHELPTISVPKPTPKKESIAGGSGKPLVKTPAKEGINVNPYNNESKLDKLKSYSPSNKDKIVKPLKSPDKSIHGISGQPHIEDHSLLDKFNNSQYSKKVKRHSKLAFDFFFFDFSSFSKSF